MGHFLPLGPLRVKVKVVEERGTRGNLQLQLREPWAFHVTMMNGSFWNASVDKFGRLLNYKCYVALGLGWIANGWVEFTIQNLHLILRSYIFDETNYLRFLDKGFFFLKKEKIYLGAEVIHWKQNHVIY